MLQADGIVICYVEYSRISGQVKMRLTADELRQARGNAPETPRVRLAILERYIKGSSYAPRNTKPESLDWTRIRITNKPF